jgi:transketolase
LASASGLERGAYVLADAEGQPDVILLASGSEVEITLQARETLAQQGIQARVVSMPSWELFEEQADDYKETVLPPQVTARVAIEAAVPFGWERYVGRNGAVIGLTHFGASAPYKILYEQFGLTTENLVQSALDVLSQASKTGSGD